MNRYRFVFLLPDADRNKGGAKVILDHVRGLCALGARASVLARADGAPGAHWGVDVDVTEMLPKSNASEVVVVVPEVTNGKSILALRNQGFRVVLLAQSWIFLPICFGSRPAEVIAALDSVVCTSAQIAGFLSRNFGVTDACRVPVKVDPIDVDPGIRRVGVACMPAKRRFEAQLIEYLFRVRFPDLADVPWIAIDNVPHAEAIRRLRGAEYFLALPRFEGFGLPPLEAMAAGCVVVGFASTGVREYATMQNGIWLVEDDVEGVVEQLGLAVRAGRNDPSVHSARISAARATANLFGDREFMAALAQAYGQPAPVRSLRPAGPSGSASAG